MTGKNEVKKPDYANWVPKNYIYGFLIAEITVLIISFLPILLVIRIILWGVAGLILIFGVLMLNAHYHFGKDQNKLQHDVHHVLIDHLDWDGNGKALDIGTGSGGVAIKLAKKYPDATIIGLDYWGKGWDYSQSLCEENAKLEGVQDMIKFQQGTAAELPFEDQSFDCVVSNFVFHEVRDEKDKFKLLIEAIRVLKKDGVFSFQDPFLTKLFYGKIEDLLTNLQEHGVSEVNFVKLGDSIDLPRLLRLGLFLGNAGTLFGKK